MTWTPLLDVHRAMRARIEGESILEYGASDAEGRAVRGAAGVLDLSAHGRIRVSGADHVSFLQRMLTNDVASREPGEGCHALFLTDRGRVVADLWVLRLADHVLLETGPAQRTSAVDAMRAFVIMDDVTFTDVSHEWAMLSVQGPHAYDVLSAARLAPARALDALASHALVDAETVHPLVVRRDRFGETGYDLWIPWSEAETAYAELLRVGGPRGLSPVGQSAADTLRIETGLPRWGHEMHPDTLPLEAGLEDALHYDKGCYVGQEYVSRATFVGRVQWVLASGTVDGDPPEVGAELRADGVDGVAARVTSSAWSSTLGAAVLLLSVRRACAAPGTALMTADGRRAVVRERPLVRGEGALVPIGAPHPLARRE